jgi:putative ABC transport system substrate-binding protein
MTRERAEALLTFPSPMLFAERRRLVTLAAKHRLPAMFNSNEFVSLGGLLAYGANLLELQRRAGLYAAQILKGAKPGDLPVEQPTNFDLAVNLKTARALDLTIPRPLLLRATLVIE